jgi:hypothetical protein
VRTTCLFDTGRLRPQHYGVTVGPPLTPGVGMCRWFFVMLSVATTSVAFAQEASTADLAHDSAVSDADANAPAAIPNPRARAEALALGSSERALALYVARVAFNESLDSEPDLAMIWNIVLSSGDTTQRRIDWLRSHSRCVMGVVPREAAASRRGHCLWTRDLLPDGARPPAFNECRDDDRDGQVDAPCHGRWARVRTRWLAHLERALEYVAGARTLIVCPSTPDTWDGRRWLSDAVARGHVPLNCKGTRNEGYMYRSRARREAVAQARSQL